MTVDASVQSANRLYEEDDDIGVREKLDGDSSSTSDRYYVFVNS